MSFEPPRCPNRLCARHKRPLPGFYRRHGSYRPKCRRRAVPRFYCKSCGRTFSRQTFRHDYRDRRPHCNARLFDFLTSGVGLRQSGRKLDLSIGGVQRKMRKIARTCSFLHENCSRKLPNDRTFLLDEEETYEEASIRPLTVPLLIEKKTWFLVASAVGSIRRLAPEGTARRRRQDREERRFGRRRDESKKCVRKVMTQLARRVSGPLTLRTDQKSSYATMASGVFGDRVQHQTTAGTLIRSTSNPLFAINQTIAMTRDNCGRLRRKSWLVTKRASDLARQLAIFTVYRNYVRRRHNYDKRNETAAVLLSLLPRGLRVREVVGWRQDWGMLSISPLRAA